MSTKDDKQPDRKSALAAKAEARQPYRRPELKRLGTVAELTLGGGVSGLDKGGHKVGL